MKLNVVVLRKASDLKAIWKKVGFHSELNLGDTLGNMLKDIGTQPFWQFGCVKLSDGSSSMAAYSDEVLMYMVSSFSQYFDTDPFPVNKIYFTFKADGRWQQEQRFYDCTNFKDLSTDPKNLHKNFVTMTLRFKELVSACMRSKTLGDFLSWFFREFEPKMSKW